MWLKLKILLGYVILLLLLVLTIHIFRKEQTRRNSLRQDEHELACIRHLAGETYAACWDWPLTVKQPASGMKATLDSTTQKKTVSVTCCRH